MKLLEVADLFKELAVKCPELEGLHFVIMKEEIAPKLSVGYELVVRLTEPKIGIHTNKVLHEIADARGLKTSMTTEIFSFYTPLST